MSLREHYVKVRTTDPRNPDRLLGVPSTDPKPRLAGLAGRDGSGVSAAEGRPAADRAMAMLRKAIDAGHRDPTEFRATDALDPLREREDFKKLVAELEKPSPAKPE